MAQLLFGSHFRNFDRTYRAGPCVLAVNSRKEAWPPGPALQVIDGPTSELVDGLRGCVTLLCRRNLPYAEIISRFCGALRITRPTFEQSCGFLVQKWRDFGFQFFEGLLHGGIFEHLSYL